MRVERYGPASTGWLIVSILFANKLWISDATSMSLYWVTRLPIKPTKADRAALAPSASKTNRRHQKIALSLAVVGALAAPFVSRTLKERPTSSVMLPLTPEQKVEWTDEVQSYRNSGACERSGERAEIDCHAQHVYERLLEQGYVGPVYRFDIFKYVAINIAVAAATFISVFVLAFLIPMLARGSVFFVRRYWRWLNA